MYLIGGVIYKHLEQLLVPHGAQIYRNILIFGAIKLLNHASEYVLNDVLLGDNNPSIALKMFLADLVFVDPRSKSALTTTTDSYNRNNAAPRMQVEDYLYQKDLYLPLVGEKPEAMNANG
ncbi:hypothetical protein RJ639_016336 [Escallonia herrerae]|uniref:Uncharacterized protein n=1 Tax=Escallonia herrerae TaxID=1293975 RepID=A0AA88VBI8_9ASTE|nr:hypothetical protein RJ639_016336 [Escallonia herrerae]